MITRRTQKSDDGISRRLPIVGVMGSGTHSHKIRSGMVGRWLAAIGVHLLTGGGGGVMAAVSEAFSRVPERRGSVIGIIPGGTDGGYRTPTGYPNPWVEIPIFTHLPLSGTAGTDLASRNHINILTSQVIVALPGGAGTASEVMLALRYGRPLVAFLSSPAEIPDLPADVVVADEFEQVKHLVRSVLNASVA